MFAIGVIKIVLELYYLIIYIISKYILSFELDYII